MVRYRDSSTIAQLGLPDMRLAIQYALIYPERVDSGLPRMGLADFANLTFEAPDEARFPALRIARDAVAAGGTMPAVMNAANETAVGMFLQEKISYPGMMRVVEATMAAHTPAEPTFECILDADAWARQKAAELS
jgi:1-deoxy-D-xylulose-5-phosphate reductoisomerase